MFQYKPNHPHHPLLALPIYLQVLMANGRLEEARKVMGIRVGGVYA